MAEIIINGQRAIEGKCTASRSVDYSTSPAKLTITGMLQTEVYIEQINTIQFGRTKVNGIRVNFESVGSDDDNIVYEFVAEEMEIEGSENGE